MIEIIIVSPEVQPTINQSIFGYLDCMLNNNWQKIAGRKLQRHVVQLQDFPSKRFSQISLYLSRVRETESPNWFVEGVVEFGGGC